MKYISKKTFIKYGGKKIKNSNIESKFYLFEYFIYFLIITFKIKIYMNKCEKFESFLYF